MKSYRLLALCVMAVFCLTAYAQENKQNNTVQAIKIKELNLRKANLQKQIIIEDQKRNQTLSGVTAETQEMLNNKQDSICLELRSQLVSVELELKELVPDQTASTIANQFRILHNQQQSSGNTTTDKEHK